MFGYLWNQYLGSGVLVLTSHILDKTELDALVGRTKASVLADTTSLAYVDFTNFQVIEQSRAVAASGSGNLQVPRYGKRAEASVSGILNPCTVLKSGEIGGAIILLGGTITTHAGSLTYGQGKEVVGTHKYVALGSEPPTITVSNNYSYYYN